MRSERRWYSALALLVVLFILASCSPAASPTSEKPAAAEETKEPGEVVTIQYLGRGDPEEEATYRELFEMFEERNPNIKVDVIWIPGGATEIFQKLQTMIGGGTPPDVFWVHSWIGVPLAVRGALLDLTSMVEADSDIDIDDYYRGSYEDFMYQGKLYALPREAATLVLYYNKDLFDAAGVGYPEKGWNWDDFLAAAKQLTQGEGADKIWGAQAPNSIFLWYSKALQDGAPDLIDLENKKANLCHPATVDAINYAADLIYEEGISPSPDMVTQDQSLAFDTGRIAMAWSGYFRIQTYESSERSFTYDVAPLPQGKRKVLVGAGSAHSAYSGTEHPQEAYELVKFLADEDASRLYGASGLVIPPLKSVAEELVRNAPGEPEHRSIFLDELELAEPFPIAPGWSEALSAITNGLSLVWVGEKRAEDVCGEIEEQVNDILSQAE